MWQARNLGQRLHCLPFLYFLQHFFLYFFAALIFCMIGESGAAVISTGTHCISVIFLLLLLLLLI